MKQTLDECIMWVTKCYELAQLAEICSTDTCGISVKVSVEPQSDTSLFNEVTIFFTEVIKEYTCNTVSFSVKLCPEKTLNELFQELYEKVKQEISAEMAAGFMEEFERWISTVTE